MRVIVIGCGIGGAATSLGLSRVGISHVVLEQAGELAEVGAGLQIESECDARSAKSGAW